MTDTLVATPDPDDCDVDWAAFDDWLDGYAEGEGLEAFLAESGVDVIDDDDDGYDYWGQDHFPEPSHLDAHPRFIVVRDDAEDELTGFSVRGRGQDRTYDDGEYPIYNEPLLRGDALWCELAATALNERG